MEQFKVVVVGLGVQGKKRALIAGSDLVATVDLDIANKADFKKITELNLNTFDAVLLCTPDNPNDKISLIKYFLENKKHVLVEKPLFPENYLDFQEIKNLARSKKVYFYVAYNHRFEPHFKRMRDLIESSELGSIYNLRMFYGNGTARLVKNSIWRDSGKGVVMDIGSHLVDTLLFWFGKKNLRLNNLKSFNYENKSPDHAIMSGSIDKINFQLEVSLLSWKNSFTCDVFAEKGTAHINSLCKWGPSEFIIRKRKYPSGLPDEKKNYHPKYRPDLVRRI